MTAILKYFFIIIGSIFSLYSLYSCIVRYLKIKDLPKDVIRERDKEDYLKSLQKYSLICLLCLFLTATTLFSPILEIRLVIPIIAIVVCGFVLQDLLDEIEDFDISKKDVDIIKDFLIKTKNETQEKAKTNKIKKIDSIQDISDIEDTSEEFEEDIEEQVES